MGNLVEGIKGILSALPAPVSRRFYQGLHTAADIEQCDAHMHMLTNKAHNYRVSFKDSRTDSLGRPTHKQEHDHWIGAKVLVPVPNEMPMAGVVCKVHWVEADLPSLDIVLRDGRAISILASACKKLDASRVAT